jgi:hypothetical protein
VMRLRAIRNGRRSWWRSGDHQGEGRVMAMMGPRLADSSATL